MILRIEINLDGAAFEDDWRGELSTIFAAILRGPDNLDPGEGNLRDSNDNTCGKWEISEEEPEARPFGTKGAAL